MIAYFLLFHPTPPKRAFWTWGCPALLAFLHTAWEQTRSLRLFQISAWRLSHSRSSSSSSRVTLLWEIPHDRNCWTSSTLHFLLHQTLYTLPYLTRQATSPTPTSIIPPHHRPFSLPHSHHRLLLLHSFPPCRHQTSTHLQTAAMTQPLTPKRCWAVC